MKVTINVDYFLSKQNIERVINIDLISILKDKGYYEDDCLSEVLEDVLWDMDPKDLVGVDDVSYINDITFAFLDTEKQLQKEYKHLLLPTKKCCDKYTSKYCPECGTKIK